jgi:GR25 family glycosyltransferase involved in LPS biosynthesis
MKSVKLICFFLLCAKTLPIQADVQNYLKKAEGKQLYHNMRNIDFIYMINLDRRPEKFAMSKAALDPYMIYPYRFSAINGWELPLTTIDDIGAKLESGMKRTRLGTIYPLDWGGKEKHVMMNEIGKRYFGHQMSRGAIACVLSHISVLQDAYDSGYKTIWVMEDDIEVIQDPRTISNLIDKLDETVGKKEWDILFTDRDSKDIHGNYVTCRAPGWRINFKPKHPENFAIQKKIGHHFRKIGARFGTYSMIIRRSGIKKILNYIKQYQIFLPYDIDLCLTPDICMYTVQSDVVSTVPLAPTDNGVPNYLNSSVGK